MDRKRFLSAGALGAGALWLAAGKPARASQDKLRIGIIGTANRASSNIAGVAHEDIVALCDTNDDYLAAAKKRFPDAAVYHDFRALIDHKGLDAVVVSTADHTHAPATGYALQAGLHTYCEKPLTHTVWEARRIAELAARHRRATQMGTQIHAEPNYRRVVEIVRSGVLGPVREVHTWVRKIWSGAPLSADPPAAPAGIHWDLWLGPAAERAYHPDLIPAKWRGYWEYGNGTLGDMGCHHMDLAFWALDLRYPETVEAQGPPVDPERTPEWLTVKYGFPARGEKPPVTLTWYDGDRVPRILQEVGAPEWGGGNLFVGEKGMLLADYSRWKLWPEKDFKDYVPPAPSIPDSIGHYREWLQACRTGGPTTCNFDYSGALSETVLLGNVAYRTGQKLEWDPKRLKATNCADADRYLRRPYRSGWSL